MMQLCLTVLTKNQSCSEFQALKLILENMGINNSNFIANQNFFTRISDGVSMMFTDKDKVWDVLFSVWVKIFDWFLQPPALLDIIIEHMLQRQLVCLSVCLFVCFLLGVSPLISLFCISMTKSLREEYEELVLSAPSLSLPDSSRKGRKKDGLADYVDKKETNKRQEIR